MRIPLATYRLQFGPSLRFADARALIPYLAELGISDLYASPIFKATPGSTHGYDVTDPNELNPELGTPEEFQALVAEVRARGMGWLQDIVPNHMAYSSENRMLMDVFENGPHSRYYEFFDVFHDHPDPALRTRVLAPFLGGPLEEVLQRGKLQLVLDDDGLALRYFNWRFPLCLASYDDILGHGDPMSGSRAGDDPDRQTFATLREIFARLRQQNDSPEKRQQVADAKATLVRLHREHPMIRLYLDGVLESYNRAVDKTPPERGRTDSSPWHRLLERQVFWPVFWQVAYKTINYRRFFYLSEFIALRTEEPHVFQSAHGKILDLVKTGVFTGLRVDHIDGLYNPRQYLMRLYEAAPQTYLVVEKILELYEFLRTEWPIQGTSGYKFCNYVNGIFCRRENERALTDLYHEFIGARADYSQLLYEAKRKILEERMAGEVAYLAHLAQRAAASGNSDGTRPCPSLSVPAPPSATGVQKALTALMAAFPVYRTYADATHSTGQDRTVLAQAARAAAEKCPECQGEVQRLVDLLLSALQEGPEDAAQRARRRFLMRFQQFTGPAMAKGFEDTLLYVYNRFLSLNEVGGDPSTFGLSLDQFHNFLQLRARHWPHAMNATSTHDSKRGEDIRARLNVLSEIPDRWRDAVLRWARMNERHKQRCGEILAPDRNDEYFLYQTLVGAWPEALDDFKQRLKDYLVKAIREAKTYGTWMQPNEPYENASRQFVDRILTPTRENPFWGDFLPFQREISIYGVYNSLSQTVLKITCTGLPDFYQGSELWDLNLVDPDNRRSVDWQRRTQLLRELGQFPIADLGFRIADSRGVLSANPQSEIRNPKCDGGLIKLFLIHRGLRVRRENRTVFDTGAYIPASVTGRHASHVVAFFRSEVADRRPQAPKTGESSSREDPPRESAIGSSSLLPVLVVAPRFLTSLVRPDQPPLGRAVWEDTSITLPGDAPHPWHNALTEETLEVQGTIPVGDILAQFPVAILTRLW